MILFARAVLTPEQYCRAERGSTFGERNLLPSRGELRRLHLRAARLLGDCAFLLKR